MKASKKLLLIPVFMLVGVCFTACSSSKDLAKADFSKEVKVGEAHMKEGITIDGFDVSGKTYKQSQEIVLAARNNKDQTPIKISKEGKTGYIPWSKIGVSFVETDDVVRRAISFGNEPGLIMRYKSSVDSLYDGLNVKSEIKIDEATLTNYIKNDFHDLDTPAKNATITRSGNGFNITEGEPGIGLNTEETSSNLIKAIKEEGFNKALEVEAVGEVTQPHITAADLSTIKDKIGTYTTSVGGSSARVSNVKLAASRINGAVLVKGDEFSVSDTILSRNEANGYQKAPQYAEGGQTEEGYGGGVCQVSSTLYNALLLAEVKVTERHCHSMTVSYCPVSQDAAISEGYLDLKFRNDFDNAIYVEAIYNNGQLTFNIYGTETRPSNRKIEYKSEILEQTYPEDKIVYDENQYEDYRSTSGAKHAATKAQMSKLIYIDGKLQSSEVIHKDSYEGSALTITIGTKKKEPETTVPETTTAEETTESEG